MAVETHRLNVQTRGESDVVDLTERVSAAVASGAIRHGQATIFVIGSTAGLTTTEFEPGLATHDLAAAFEKIAPRDAAYRHEETWHDDNGHAHVRASLLGPSLAVPLVDGRLTLGQWQQIVLIDFDTRPRRREIVVQVLGEIPAGRM
jgi:secondary thiamine-phosphate synthase enzyme